MEAFMMPRLFLCLSLIAVLITSIPALGEDLDQGRITIRACQVLAGIRNNQNSLGSAGGREAYPVHPELEGTWNWVGGQTLVIHHDGTFDVYLNGGKINEGHWTSLGRNQYRFVHRNGGYVDTVTLSPDGNALDGTNNRNSALHGSRSGAPEVPAHPASVRPQLEGTWNWVSGQTLVLHPDGTLDVYLNGQKINEGHWTSLGGNQYRFVHRNGGWVDTVTLSPDGRALDGTNNHNAALHGSRSGTPEVSAHPASAHPQLEGTWNWVGGQTLVIHRDGTLDVYLNGGKINEGHWTNLGGNQYRFVHRNGGWVDTVTLSPDGNALDGTNNRNSALHGSRR
jgi:hypothetical protein